MLGRVLVAATAALLVAGQAQAVTPDPAAAEAAFPRRTEAVTARAHLIYKPNPTDPPFEGNVTVIEQSRGLVVVDAGGSPPSGRNIVREIRRISGKPVRQVIYTHYHGDHNLGAAEIRRAWPSVEIISTARTRENMIGAPMAYVATYAKSYGDMADFAGRQAADPKLPQALRDGWARYAALGPGVVAGYQGMTPVLADQTFTERLVLPDAVAPLEVFYLGRGNTDGDAVVWAPKQKLLVSGDLIVAPIPYAAHTYPGEWIETLKKLRAIPFDSLVPGHGPVLRDRAYIDQVIAALETVRAQVGPLARAGTPLAEVRKQVDLTAMRAGFTKGDPWLEFLIGAVFTGDLVTNAYKEARGEEIVQGKG
jgi:glyoxylase-like metal-dependent hydrolase (beta-lactamase superfamily II)